MVRHGDGPMGWDYSGSSGVSGFPSSIDYTGRTGKMYRRLRDGTVLCFDGGLWFDEQKNIIPQEEVNCILQKEQLQNDVDKQLAAIRSVAGIYPYGRPEPKEESEEERTRRRALECKTKKEASQRLWSRRLRRLAFAFLLVCLLFGFLVHATP